MKPYTVGVSEFCRLVGIKRTTAYKILASGAVTKVRIEGRTLITLESIERFISASVVRSPEDLAGTD